MAANIQKTKKQHFVPQFYLNHFADANNQLFAYDKTSLRSYRTSVRDIAQERFFHDFPQIEEFQKQGVDLQIVEQALGNIENMFVPTFDNILRRIENRRFKQLFRAEHRTYLAAFLVLQLVRTKEFRVGMLELEEKLYHAYLKPLVEEKFPNISFDDFKVKIEPDYQALHHDAFILNFPYQRKWAAILHNHIWQVGVNNTKQPFYVSDNPVVKWNHLSDPNNILRRISGIGSPGIEVAFPLTPKYILILCDRHVFGQLQSKDGTLVEINEDNVMYYNSLQILQSYRQVYCPTDSFELAQRMCQDSPLLSDSSRSRLELLELDVLDGGISKNKHTTDKTI